MCGAADYVWSCTSGDDLQGPGLQPHRMRQLPGYAVYASLLAKSTEVLKLCQKGDMSLAWASDFSSSGKPKKTLRKDTRVFSSGSWERGIGQIVLSTSTDACKSTTLEEGLPATVH